MKKLGSLLEYNRLKVAIGYFILVIVISFLVAAFREDFDPNAKGQIAIQDSAAATNGIDTVKVDSANTKSENEKVIEKKINDFIKLNGGVRFEENTLKYTLDYQKAYRDTIAIFYVFVEDIYEEKGKTFLKAKKIFSEISFFLKLECDTTHINMVKSVNFFVNIAAKIQSIDKVLFYTKAEISEKDNPNDDNHAYITFDTLEEGIIMEGKCLAVLI